jgi:ankyrin repeat protein
MSSARDLQRQTVKELQGMIASEMSDADLLRSIQSIPVDALKSLHDETGNTVLHQVLCRPSYSKPPHDESPNVINKWRLGGFWKKETDASRRRRRPHSDYLDLLHYLIRCTDPHMDEHGSHGSGIEQPQDESRATVSCYNSLVRVRSVGGSLPLHTACRYLSDDAAASPLTDSTLSTCTTTAATASSKTSRMLDSIEFLVQSYPRALHSADAWGNVPLHEACDNRATPLAVIIYLVQRWPESVRVTNHDGNLPLHLAASAASSSAKSKALFPRSALPNHSNDYDVLCGTLSSDPSVPPTKWHQRQLEIVQYLVHYWPDAVHHMNEHGRSPLQCATNGHAASSQARCNPHVIEFLQGFGDPATVPSGRTVRSTINPFDDIQPDILPSTLERQNTNPFVDTGEGDSAVEEMPPQMSSDVTATSDEPHLGLQRQDTDPFEDNDSSAVEEMSPPTLTDEKDSAGLVALSDDHLNPFVDDDEEQRTTAVENGATSVDAPLASLALSPPPSELPATNADTNESNSAPEIETEKNNPFDDESPLENEAVSTTAPLVENEDGVPVSPSRQRRRVREWNLDVSSRG